MIAESYAHPGRHRPGDDVPHAAHERFAGGRGRTSPKPLTDDVARAANVIVTMGCGDACPVYPGKRYLDWVLEDPAGKGVEDVRRIRDEIDGRVRTLLADLLPSEAGTSGS